jgi:hypothetical protein
MKNLNHESRCRADFRTANLSTVNLQRYLYTSLSDDNIKIHIVECLLKARILKAAQTAVPWELLRNHACCQAAAQ